MREVQISQVISFRGWYRRNWKTCQVKA